MHSLNNIVQALSARNEVILRIWSAKHPYTALSKQYYSMALQLSDPKLKNIVSVVSELMKTLDLTAGVLAMI